MRPATYFAIFQASIENVQSSTIIVFRFSSISSNHAKSRKFILKIMHIHKLVQRGILSPKHSNTRNWSKYSNKPKEATLKFSYFPAKNMNWKYKDHISAHTRNIYGLQRQLNLWIIFLQCHPLSETPTWC